jgi:hypothetical protein
MKRILLLSFAAACQVPGFAIGTAHSPAIGTAHSPALPANPPPAPTPVVTAPPAESSARKPDPPATKPDPDLVKQYDAEYMAIRQIIGELQLIDSGRPTQYEPAEAIEMVHKLEGDDVTTFARHCDERGYAHLDLPDHYDQHKPQATCPVAHRGHELAVKLLEATAERFVKERLDGFKAEMTRLKAGERVDNHHVLEMLNWETTRTAWTTELAPLYSLRDMEMPEAVFEPHARIAAEVTAAAAAAVKAAKLPAYRDESVARAARRDLKLGKDTRLVSVYIDDDRWDIHSNGYRPTYRSKTGIAVLHQGDLPFCWGFTLEATQTYEGGGSYADTRASVQTSPRVVACR